MIMNARELYTYIHSVVMSLRFVKQDSIPIINWIGLMYDRIVTYMKSMYISLFPIQKLFGTEIYIHTGKSSK